MTIEEYSTLMGYTKTCEHSEYEKANLTYLMAGNMDKQTFCKEYKKIGQSPLVRELVKTTSNYDIACMGMESKERTTAYDLLREADAIRAEVSNDPTSGIERIAEKLIGKTECIKWKLKNGYTLSESDKEYIANNL